MGENKEERSEPTPRPETLIYHIIGWKRAKRGELPAYIGDAVGFEELSSKKNTALRRGARIISVQFILGD